MRPTNTNGYGQVDVLSTWADDLRVGLISQIGPGRIGEVAASAAMLVAASTGLTMAAGAAATQGGITMSTTIGAMVASNTGMKIAAGGLTAALAAGGAAVVSGQVDTTAPAVDARVEDNVSVQGDAHADLQTRTIEVVGLGTLEVAFNESSLEITEVEAAGEGSALIRSQTQTSAVIDFTIDGATSTLFVSVVDGDLVTSLSANASAGVAANANAEADAVADGEADAGAASSSASSEAEAEVGIETEIGIEIGIGG